MNMEERKKHSGTNKDNNSTKHVSGLPQNLLDALAKPLDITTAALLLLLCFPPLALLLRCVYCRVTLSE